MILTLVHSASLTNIFSAATVAGIKAAVWLVGLWYAAKIFSHDANLSPAGRMRDCVILGVAIPFSLAMTHTLIVPVCVTSLIALCLIRSKLAPPTFRPSKAAASTAVRVARALPTIGAFAVMWPAMVRPLLQGDSLGYHLPNAASWSQQHSFWITNTSYWWYPGGSELFACGVYTVAGPLTIGLSGGIILVLLGQRLFEFALQEGVKPLVSGALSCMAVTTSVVAMQAANLQNDVWLAAFTVEIMWCIRFERAALWRTSAICSIIKVYGCIITIVCLLFAKTRLLVVLVAIFPIVVWIARDVILSHTALISATYTSYPHLEQTTIAFQGRAGIRVLVDTIAKQDTGFLILIVSTFATIVARRNNVMRLTTAFLVILFLVLPYGFRNDIPQLATGQSLRFLLPGLMVGFVAAFPMLSRRSNVVAAIAFGIAAVQVFNVEQIFKNDATTHNVFIVICIVSIVLVLSRGEIGRSATALVAASLITYAARLSGTHPTAYYGDLLAKRGKPSTLFHWLETSAVQRLVAWRLRSGSINVLIPGVTVFDVNGADPCHEARELGAILLISDDPASSSLELDSRRRAGRQCGLIMFDDGTSLLVRPRDT